MTNLTTPFGKHRGGSSLFCDVIIATSPNFTLLSCILPFGLSNWTIVSCSLVEFLLELSRRRGFFRWTLWSLFEPLKQHLKLLRNRRLKSPPTAFVIGSSTYLMFSSFLIVASSSSWLLRVTETGDDVTNGLALPSVTWWRAVTISSTTGRWRSTAVMLVGLSLGDSTEMDLISGVSMRVVTVAGVVMATSGVSPELLVSWDSIVLWIKLILLEMNCKKSISKVIM